MGYFVLVGLWVVTEMAERRAAALAERGEYAALYQKALIARLSGEDTGIADSPVQATLVDDQKPN